MQVFSLAIASLCAVSLVVAHEPLSKELIDFVNFVQDDWQAGENDRFKTMEYKQLEGMLKSFKKADHEELRKKHKLPEIPVITRSEPVDVPEHFDAREKWAFCPSVHEIRDQSACGSCWAFGASTVMTDRVCIHSNGSMTPHISAEDLMSCCDICGEGGCKGGSVPASFQHWVMNGLVTGSNYDEQAGCSPYLIPPCDHHTTGRRGTCGKTYQSPPCKKQCQPGYNSTYDEDKYYGKSVYMIKPNDIVSMQREIMTYGPVVMGFTVYADFFNYQKGVYHHTTGEYSGEHAVRVLGWGTERGIPYWLVANSWNADWAGLGGFFKIRRGTGESGFEQDVTAGMAKV